MQRVLRFLLVWLLAVAMPLKGMAAAVMLLCAPLPAASVVQAMPSHLAQGHAAHDGAQHHQHFRHASQAKPPQPPQHATHATHATQGDAASADDHGGSSGHAHAVAKCGACAAIAAGLPRVAPPPPGAQGFEPMALGAVRFLTDGPDRPPRSTIG